MGNSQRPSPTQLKLGAAIRRHREAAGLAQAALADHLNYSVGWLSNLETGQLRPKREAVAKLERTLGLPEGVLMDLFDLLADEALPGWFRPWLEEEGRASGFRWFEPLIVPGLLQNEDYARALLDGDEEALRTRMQRQAILAGKKPPTLRCVLDELVLHREVGGPKVMYDQLMRLVESVSPRTSVQVVPAALNPHRTGTFVIAAVDGEEVGYVETAVRGMVTGNRDEIARLSDAWESIRTFALSQQESIEFITRTAEEKWT